MEPTIYTAEHRLFRDAFRTFVDREVRPHQERWAEAGMVHAGTNEIMKVIIARQMGL